MKIHVPAPRPRAENTIALINVVFLLLVFFLVAGTIASQSERAVKLAASQQGVAAESNDGVIALMPDGSLMRNGEVIAITIFIAETAPDMPVRIAADRDAPAERLVAVIADLRAAGFGDVAVLVSRTAGEPVQ